MNVLLVALSSARLSPADDVPPNHARTFTTYDWCDCRSGSRNVTFWPAGSAAAVVTVPANAVVTVILDAPTARVAWQCDMMAAPSFTKLDQPSTVLSLRLTSESKSSLGCRDLSGRLKWTGWQEQPPAADPTSVPFSSYANGYACLKIPVLLRTRAGSLLAFAEARRENCSDFARTDLVVRRSVDEGATWSELALVGAPPEEADVGSADVGSLGLCGNPLVVGNAAPVQLAAGESAKHPERILVPHMRNNYEVWLASSDDDGATWSAPRPVPNVTVVAPEGPDCARVCFSGLDLDCMRIALDCA